MYGAALAAGQAAWNAGQNVETALTALGYAAYVARGVRDYFESAAEEGLMPEMSPTSTGSTKRGRFTVPTGTTKKVAPAVKKYVKTCMNRLIDDKYTTKDISQLNISTSGVVDGSIITIVQGTSDATRVGNMVRIKGLTIRGTFSDSVPVTGRVLVFFDRQANGSAPAWGELVSQNNVNGTFNHDTVISKGGSRFEILCDKRVAINPDTQFHQELFLYNWSGDRVVRYDTNTGATTDIVSNNLCVAFISTAATLDFNGYIDVKFNDA